MQTWRAMGAGAGARGCITTVSPQLKMGVVPTAPGLSKDPGERCAAFDCPVQTRRICFLFSVKWMSAIS